MEYVADMDVLWNTWDKSMTVITEECIPNAVISPRCSLPRMKKNITGKITIGAVFIAKEEKQEAHLYGRSIYQSLRNKVGSIFRQSQRYYLKIMPNQGGKQFWKAVKFLKEASSQIPKKGSDEIDKTTFPNEVFSQNFDPAIPL